MGDIEFFILGGLAILCWYVTYQRSEGHRKTSEELRKQVRNLQSELRQLRSR